MFGLKDAILVRPEFLEFCFEELRLLVRNGLLVEDQYVRDVVRVDLGQSASCLASLFRGSYLLLEIFQYLRPLFFDQVQFSQ